MGVLSQFPQRRRSGYAPKPDNFDALAAAWDDPHRFEIERRRYQEQLEGNRRRQA